MVAIHYKSYRYRDDASYQQKITTGASGAVTTKVWVMIELGDRCQPTFCLFVIIEFHPPFSDAACPEDKSFTSLYI